MNTKLEIEAALRKYFEAFSSKNAGQFSDCPDDNFTYFTDNCTIQKKDDFIDFIVKNSWESTGYQITDLEIITSDQNDLVIAVYKAEFDGRTNGKPLKVFATETTVFTYKNSSWRILHSHTSNKV